MLGTLVIDEMGYIFDEFGNKKDRSEMTPAERAANNKIRKQLKTPQQKLKRRHSTHRFLARQMARNLSTVNMWRFIVLREMLQRRCRRRCRIRPDTRRK